MSHRRDFKSADTLACRLIDDAGIDGALARQMHSNPRSFNFSAAEVAEIEANARDLPLLTAFARTVQLALDRGFIRVE